MTTGTCWSAIPTGWTTGCGARGWAARFAPSTSRRSTSSVLGDRLGIGPDEVAAGTRLAYTRSESDARERVARGEATAAILVRPTRLDQLAAVAAAGDVMPQKSTYFYPKLLTGMVFNPLED